MKMQFILPWTICLCVLGQNDKDEDGGVNDCTGPRAVGEVMNMTVDGKLRCYTVYKPSDVATPMPVMVFFHGKNGRATQSCRQGHEYVTDADSFGYALICGDAHLNWQFPRAVNSDSTQPCTGEETADFDYVENILDDIAASPDVYDTEKIYFFGFSRGAMMTTYASMCFADRIRGVAQGGSALKLHGAAVTSEWCESSPSDECEPGVTDGVNIPGDSGTCDECEYFPLQPAKLDNVVGEPLRWCLYGGCSDFLLDSVINMANYQKNIGSPYNLEYYDGDHEAPKQWMSKIATCLGIWTGTPEANEGVNCSTIEPEEGNGGGPHGGGGGIVACSEKRKNRCCGDGKCDGPETVDNCDADCNGDSSGGSNQPSPAPPAEEGGGGPILKCNAKRKKRCCGDDVCDGPERVDNCAADCGSDSGGSDSGSQDGDNGPPTTTTTGGSSEEEESSKDADDMVDASYRATAVTLFWCMNFMLVRLTCASQ